MQKYYFATDLKDEQALIEQYEYWHKKENSWKEINDSITRSGIISMEIFRTGNRLFMVIETTDWFDLSKKEELDAGNPFVQEWEKLMWKFQQPLPWAKDGEKWIRMEKIFEL